MFGGVDPEITSWRNEIFHETIFNAGGPCSISILSAAFSVGALASMVERVSERAVAVDGNCSFHSRGAGNGTLDLAGGVRICEEFLFAYLDAPGSATS